MRTVPAEAQRWEARDGGTTIGHAALWCVRGRKYRVEVVVDAAHRGRGHGDRLLAHALDEARAIGARSVQVRPNAADERSIAFAAKRAFVETLRVHQLELELAEARHADLHECMDRLASASIAIVTLADFAARSKDPFAAYVDVVEAAREGWCDPDPDLPGDEPTVDWAEIVKARASEEGSAIVAEQRGRLVGFTSALGTGVRPELRGQGIATAMKVCAIDAAIARGDTVMTTASAHPAMRHIHAKLGFREVGCELRMVRRLEQRTTGTGT